MFPDLLHSSSVLVAFFYLKRFQGMTEEIYGFWDYLFPLFVGFAVGNVILLGILTTERTKWSLSLFSLVSLGLVFVGYIMFFSIQQIDS